MAREVKTRTATITFRDDGIIVLVVDPGARVTLEDAEENMDHMPEQRYRLLVDSRKIGSMTSAARRLYTAPSTRVVAVAIVVGSPLSRVIGNFFIGLNKPAYPNKLFSSMEQAERWLANLAA
jgi:hypothetical protein